MNVLIISHYSEVSSDRVQAERLRSLRIEFQKLGLHVHFIYLNALNKLTLENADDLDLCFESITRIDFKSSDGYELKDHNFNGDLIVTNEIGKKINDLCNAIKPDVLINAFGISDNLFEYVPNNIVRILDAFGADIANNQSMLINLRKSDIVLVQDENQRATVEALSSTPIEIVGSGLTGAISGTGSKAIRKLFKSTAALRGVVGSDFDLSIKRDSSSQVVMIVTHARFWQPGWGSHVRISQLVRELSKKYRLVIFFTVNLSEKDCEDIDAIGLSFEYDWVKEKIIWNRSSEESVVLGEIVNPIVRDAFSKSVAKHKPDVCLFEYLRFTYLTSVLPSNVVKIIDTHDLISRRQESRTRYEKATPVTRKAEIKALSHYDYVIAIQRTEAAIAETWLNRLNVMYVPVCYEEKRLDNMKLSEVAPKQINVGFIGGEADANVSAIKWFTANVWPYFTGSNLKLLVAGDVGKHIKNPPENISVLGRVDIDEFYRSLHFVINPVQWGGGMKIKTVEALSYGLPVVSTSEGAAGLEEASDTGLLITDTPEEFAYLMGQLARDVGRRVQQGDGAKSFVRSEFNKSVVFNDLHSVIQMARPYPAVS